MREVAGYRDDPRFKIYELSFDLFFINWSYWKLNFPMMVARSVIIS